MSRHLTPGARLPSVRDLATLVRANPNTVQRALSELEDLGLIYTERTNGKFVTQDQDLLHATQQRFADELVAQYLQNMQKLGFKPAAAIKYLKTKGGKSGTITIR